MAITTAGRSMTLAVGLAAPMIVYGIVFNVALGLAARLAPALQVFFIAQPLNLTLGLAIFANGIGRDADRVRRRHGRVAARGVGSDRMADKDQKTHDPSAKRLEDARKKGDTPTAPEMRHGGDLCGDARGAGRRGRARLFSAGHDADAGYGAVPTISSSIPTERRA